MNERPPINKVPIQGVLKYIVAERDKYKNKLETLIPYTKSLEEKYKDLKSQYDDLLQRFADNEVKKGIYNSAVKENEFMRAELKAFRDDYKQTSWYDQMSEDRKKWKEKYQKLLKAFNALIAAQHIDEQTDTDREI